MGSPNVVDLVNEYLVSIGPSYSFFTQLLLNEILNDAEDYLDQNKKELRWRLKTIVDSLSDLNNQLSTQATSIISLDGGSHSIAIKVNLDHLNPKLQMDPFYLTRWLLEEHDLACPPGITHGLSPNTLRLNYGCIGADKGLRESCGNNKINIAAAELAKLDFSNGRSILGKGITKFSEALFQMYKR
jgi:aspartate/methionine/tyrosine aminotransferase